MEIATQQSLCLQKLKFSKNQTVWVKIAGFPWWPALVTSLPSKSKSQFRVDFYCDNTHAFVHESKMAKYTDLRNDDSICKNQNKGLRKAIEEADQLTMLDATAGGDTIGLHNLSELKSERQKQLSDQYKEVDNSLQENQSQSIQQQLPENHSQDNQIDFPLKNHSYTNQQRKRIVQNLLQKYKLDHIPEVEGTVINSTKKIQKPRLFRKKAFHWKKKHQIRQVDENSANKCQTLLIRKIYGLLKNKQDMEKSKKKEISMNLGESFRVIKQQRKECVYKLFKWLTMSKGEVISSFYQSWNTFSGEKEKSSSMTIEQ